MVSAWAKKAVDPEPLCGKVDQDHAIGDNAWKLGDIVQTQDAPFPVKGYSASICIS